MYKLFLMEKQHIMVPSEVKLSVKAILIKLIKKPEKLVVVPLFIRIC
jgi:hypothetical protein